MALGRDAAWAFTQAWFGGAPRDFVWPSREEAQRILDAQGLTGPMWAL